MVQSRVPSHPIPAPPRLRPSAAPANPIRGGLAPSGWRLLPFSQPCALGPDALDDGRGCNRIAEDTDCKLPYPVAVSGIEVLHRALAVDTRQQQCGKQV